jgi:SulP family sulfate permease
LGLVAFAPLAAHIPASSLALWSAAVPGALMALLSRGKGVVYAPSTAVALLFSGMLALVLQAGQASGISAGQALAMAGVFAALGFLLQWFMARMGLARLARFIPVSVTQGFSAGVGLTLVWGQLYGLVRVSGFEWSALLWWQLALAAGVVLLSQGLQRVWPRFPALLLAVVLVSLFWFSFAPQVVGVKSAAEPMGFMLPPVPDALAAPWWAVLRQCGFQLASLSLLMAVVNSLDVLVYHQQLETEVGQRGYSERVLAREGLIGALCALCGMIPASTSPSRSRVALSYTGAPSRRVGQWHALGLIAVALTGHVWLHQVPIAVLMGALLIAGVRMVPSSMWGFEKSNQRRMSLAQSWLVGLVFAASSGAMALLAGLAVATAELLRTSGNHAVRRIHLRGKLRSRHVRRAEVELWLAPRMKSVAVFELQGIVSFGVAALVVEQVRQHLAHHRCVILDASRVPSWDETGCLHLRALAHELHKQGVVLVFSGVRGWVARRLFDLHLHEDLDRALEWAEEQILASCPEPMKAAESSMPVLGELGAEMNAQDRQMLEARMTPKRFEPNETIIRLGDHDRTLFLVQSGTVTLSTSEVPNSGLRLAVIGPGSVFGEMAFLNGIARTAYAHVGDSGATVSTLSWEQFQEWSQASPVAALAFVTALAKMGIRRLGATSQELRAAME